MEVRNYNRLSVSEILSKSFNILKNNILEVLKVIGIFILPITIITVGVIFGVFISNFVRFALMSPYLNADDIFSMVSLSSMFLVFLLGIIATLVVVYANAVIIKIIDDANKGNQVSWRSANSYVWERKWRVIGLNILVWIILFFFIIIFVILGVLLSALTLGIGLIIFIPAIITISIMVAPFWGAFNSILIVNNINITDAIRETFLLFRRGYFWSTVGNFAAISGITIGVGIVLGLFSAIPFLGFFIVLIGQILIQVYLLAYTAIYVADRTKPLDSYNMNNSHSNLNSNNVYNHNYYNSVNNDYNGLNDSYNGLNNEKEDMYNNSNKDNDFKDSNLLSDEKNDNNDEDNKDNNSGFIDPID